MAVQSEKNKRGDAKVTCRAKALLIQADPMNGGQRVVGAGALHLLRGCCYCIHWPFLSPFLLLLLLLRQRGMGTVAHEMDGGLPNGSH